MGSNHTMIKKDSLKRKCGFYIKDRINYKPRADLDIAIMMIYFSALWF